MDGCPNAAMRFSGSARKSAGTLVSFVELSFVGIFVIPPVGVKGNLSLLELSSFSFQGI